MSVEIPSLVFRGAYGSLIQPVVYDDGSYVYAVDSTSLRAYQIINSNLILITSVALPDLFYAAFLSGDGTYIYVAYRTNLNNGRLEAFTFDGVSFTFASGYNLTAGTFPYTGYYSTGSIYLADTTNKLRRYTFDGAVFTEQASISHDLSSTSSSYQIVRVGAYLYAPSASIPGPGRALRILDPQTLTQLYKFQPLNSVENQVASVNGYLVWLQNSTNKLFTATYNGVTFSNIDSIVSTDAVSFLYGSGQYLYVSHDNISGSNHIGSKYIVSNAGFITKDREYILNYNPVVSTDSAVFGSRSEVIFASYPNGFGGLGLVLFAESAGPDHCPISDKYLYIPLNKTVAPIDYAPFWSLLSNDPDITSAYTTDGLNVSGPGNNKGYDTFSTGIRLQCSDNWTFEIKVKKIPQNSIIHFYANATFKLLRISRDSTNTTIDVPATGSGPYLTVSNTDLIVKLVKTGSDALSVFLNGIAIFNGTITPGGSYDMYRTGLQWLDFIVGDDPGGGGAVPYVDLNLQYVYAINSNMPLNCLGPAVVASFTLVFNPLSEKAPNTVTFTDTSTGTPSTWLWDFGDGNSSTFQNPVHTYNNAGQYTATLTVTNDVSTDTTVNIFYVHFDMYFDASPLLTTPNIPVIFNNTSVGDPLYWLWDFGDGSTGSAQNPSHAYTGIGSYSITLYAGATGLSDSYSRPNYISIVSALSADFSATPVVGYYPLTVTFTDMSGGVPISWLWYFGDGTSSSLQNPTHTYTSPGIYSVTLTVSDGSGTDSETKTNYIYSKIVIDATPILGIVPLEVSFSTPYVGLSYLWDFGDGTTSAEAAPKHTYTIIGNHTISIRAMNSIGQWVPGYEEYFISVSKLDFSVNPNAGKLPLSVQFLNKSVVPTGCEFSDFYWSYGDGVTGSAGLYTYTGVGSYNPALNATLTKI